MSSDTVSATGTSDMETIQSLRCLNCRRFAYTCGGVGEDTVGGFICCYCIDLMDGKFV